LAKRPPVQISLGCHYLGFARPHGDPSDPLTFVAGVRKRFAFKPPDPYLEFYMEMADFTLQWCEEYLTPLAPDTDLSIEYWLAHTNYPLYRKQELQALFDECLSIWSDPKFTDCEMHMKDEVYPEYKHVRAINARHDRFKIEIGPTIKAIENVIYALPEFIKHVPVALRPKYIYNLLHEEGATYFPTDYTAYESLFVNKLMNACEFIVYRHLTKFLPNHQNFMRCCTEVIGGKFKTVNKNFSVSVKATRMSGEMNTSVGNGISNLLFMKFACKKSGAKSCKGVVEGDDGLFRIIGNPPTTELFASMGLVIKMKAVHDISEASFCGCVFDPIDMINITDPFKVLLTTGWTHSQYAAAGRKKKNALLLSKGLSLIAQYPGSPVIQSFGMYIIRVLKPQVSKWEMLLAVSGNRARSNYNKVSLDFSLLYDCPPVILPIPINTRMLMEKQFNFDIRSQMLTENYFDHCSIIQPIKLPFLDHLFHPSTQHYYLNYCRQVSETQMFSQSDFMPLLTKNEFTVEYQTA